jgi:hypothetical protein
MGPSLDERGVCLLLVTPPLLGVARAGTHSLTPPPHTHTHMQTRPITSLLARERERGKEYSRRVGGSEKSWEKWEVIFVGREKEHSFSEVSQASPGHSSDKSRVELKTLGWLWAVAWDRDRGILISELGSTHSIIWNNSFSGFDTNGA